MRFSAHLRRPVLICGYLLLSVSCTPRPQKQAALPPPPKPAAVQDQSQNVPLSVPQTAVVLPSQQQLSPGAIPPPPAAPSPVPTDKQEEPVGANKKPPSRPPRAPAEVKPEPAPEEAPPPAPAPAAVDEKGPFQPILSPEEKKRLQDSVDGRMRQIEGLLARAKGHVSEHDQSVVERIHSFVNLAKEAAQSGDYTQANNLTDRALILARELNVE